MKILIYGAGPIGRWLALGLHNAGKDVTLLARNNTYKSVKQNGIILVDGHTNEKKVAKVKVTENCFYDRYLVCKSFSRLPDVYGCK